MQVVPILLFCVILFVLKIPFLGFYEDIEELRCSDPTSLFPGIDVCLRAVIIKLNIGPA